MHTPQLDDITADIRNKLTLPKTVLEKIKQNKEVKKVKDRGRS
jgi:non-canonical (house-cleaning) NTP pyrophosphatase